MTQGINGIGINFQGVFSNMKMPKAALNADSKSSVFTDASVNNVSNPDSAQKPENAKLQEKINNAKSKLSLKSDISEISKQGKQIAKLLENSMVNNLPMVGGFINTKMQFMEDSVSMCLSKAFSELAACKTDAEIQSCIQRNLSNIQKEILKGRIYVKRGYKAIELDQKLSHIYNDPDKAKFVQSLNIEKITDALMQEVDVNENGSSDSDVNLDSNISSGNSPLDAETDLDDSVMKKVDEFLSFFEGLNSGNNNGNVNNEFIKPENIQSNQNNLAAVSQNTNFNLSSNSVLNTQNSSMTNPFAGTKLNLFG